MSNEHFWILVNGDPYLAFDGNPGSIYQFRKDRGGSLPQRVLSLKPGESQPLDDMVVTRVGGDACRLINITYEIVTPESAEEGDAAERGWEGAILLTRDDLDEDTTWADAAEKVLLDERTSFEADSSHGTPRWFTETEGHTDYRTGAETRRSFHPEGFTVAELDALGKALR